MPEFSILFASLTQTECKELEVRIQAILKKLDNNSFAHPMFGAWVFKTKPCYEAIQKLRGLFQQRNIPWVMLPIESHIEGALTEAGREAVASIGADEVVYSVAIDG